WKAGDCPTTVPLMKNRRGSDRIFGDVLQGAAAFDGMAFGPPTQHAAGAADGDDRTIARQFAGALAEVAERDQDRAPNVPEGAGVLLGFAHVEDLNRRRVFLETVRIDFPDPGKRISERRPIRLRRHPDAAFGPS